MKNLLTKWDKKHLEHPKEVNKIMNYLDKEGIWYAGATNVEMDWGLFSLEKCAIDFACVITDYRLDLFRSWLRQKGWLEVRLIAGKKFRTEQPKVN